MNKLFSQDSLLNIYRIREVPSDSQMRKILDEVDPTPLRQSFRSFFAPILVVSCYSDPWLQE